ncbi:MAG: hypothetical protein WDN69_10085 [Aliidongia sp.]
MRRLVGIEIGAGAGDRDLKRIELGQIGVADDRFFARQQIVHLVFQIAVGLKEPVAGELIGALAEDGIAAEASDIGLFLVGERHGIDLRSWGNRHGTTA